MTRFLLFVGLAWATALSAIAQCPQGFTLTVNQSVTTTETVSVTWDNSVVNLSSPTIFLAGAPESSKTRYTTADAEYTVAGSIVGWDLTKLAPNTTYTVWFSAVCPGNVDLTPLAQVSFTTTVGNNCLPPTFNDYTVTNQPTGALEMDLTINGAATSLYFQRKARSETWQQARWYFNSAALANYTMNLGADTIIEARIRALCADGWDAPSEYSDVFTLSTFACETPTVNSALGGGTIGELDYTASASALEYRVQYRVQGNPTWTDLVTTSTTPTISSLSPNSTYEYQVRAECSVDDLTVSSYSPVGTFATGDECVAPTVLNETGVTATTADVGWTASTSANLISSVDYTMRIRQGAAGGFSTDGTTTGTTYTYGTGSFGALTDATLYNWRILATCNYTSGVTQIAPVSATDDFTTAALSCDDPINLGVSSVGGTLASLTWDAVTGAQGYSVQLSTDGGNNYSAAAQQPAGTDVFVDLTGLTSSQQYEWQVQADCGTIQSNFAGGTLTDGVDRFTTYEQCAPPSALTVDATTSSTADLSWTAGSPATQIDRYNLDYRTDDVVGLFADESSTISSVSTTGTTTNLSSLTADQSYHWRLQSECDYPTVDYGGTSVQEQSAFVEDVFATDPACPVPSNQTVSLIGGNTARLDWDGNFLHQSFNVQVSIDNGANWVSTTPQPGGTTSFVDAEGLTALATYDWRVRGDCSGDGTDLSAYTAQTNTVGVDQFTMDDQCIPPTNLSVVDEQATSASVSFTSVAVGTSQRYRVGYGITPDADPYTNESITSATNRTLAGLASSTTYDWGAQTECTYVSGAVEDSNYATGTPPDDQFTTLTAVVCNGPPANVAVPFVNNNSASVTWDAVTNADDYTVNINLWLGFPAAVVAGPTTTTNLFFFTAGLSPGTNYIAFVRNNCPDGSSDQTSILFTTTGPVAPPQPDPGDDPSVATRMFPNPVAGDLTLENMSATQPTSFTLIDSQGNQLETLSVDPSTQEVFDVSALQPGVYFIEATNAAGTSVDRIIIQ